MRNFTDIIDEAARLNLSPEAKKRRTAILNRRKRYVATGQDTSAIDAEVAAIENGTWTPDGSWNQNTGAPKTAPKTAPGAKSAKKSKDYDQGYKDFIGQIKKIRNGEVDLNNQDQSGSQGAESGLAPVPLKPEDIKQNQQNSKGNNGGGQDGADGNGNSGSAGSQGSQKSGGGSGGGAGTSRNGKQAGQGVVRPEDCQSSISDLGSTPGTAGGMISKEQGDKLAAEEGFDKEGGNEEAVAKEWQERARQAASQMVGKGEGYDRLKAKFDGMYRATKDWKKELKKIVGHSISPDDKRSAYANKNILISQDRIARTDKDKYDNLDYMMAWIDTSGSMSQEYLNQCLNEIYQVALAKKPIKLVIVQFDTRIADIQEFTSLADLKRSMHSYQIKGGGGTEVKPCFDMLIKDKKYARRPAELVMIFTDGYLDQYKRNPKTMKNLCWVVVDNLGFDLKYKDAHTKCVRLKSEDFGKGRI